MAFYEEMIYKVILDMREYGRDSEGNWYWKNHVTGKYYPIDISDKQDLEEIYRNFEEARNESG